MSHPHKHPHITVSPVESSQIHGIGYHPETNTLAVQFKSKSGLGSIYHYANVTPEKFAEFQKAESHGKHFGAHFKNGATHPFTKVS